MRDEWQQYKTAAETLAAACGTTVICTEKNGRLRVDFDERVLTPAQAKAISLIEDMIETITEFPVGYLETLEPPTA